MALGAAVGIADGAARLERKVGRDAFRSVQVVGAAQAELSRMAGQAWGDSARAGAGRLWRLAPDSTGRIVADRWLERLPGLGDWWVMGVRAKLVDLSGRTQAAATRGLIVQFRVTDTTGRTTPRVGARPALFGFQ
jgi:hypothetical protein